MSYGFNHGARAVANCTCATCGAKFEKITFKHNRTEANSWIEWAESNIIECGDCWKKRTDAERHEQLLQAGVQIITGTDKQKAYAERLLSKVTFERILALKEEIDDIDPEKLETVSKANGESEEETVTKFLKLIGLYDAYIAITCTDAGSIIDALKEA